MASNPSKMRKMTPEEKAAFMARVAEHKHSVLDRQDSEARAKRFLEENRKKLEDALKKTRFIVRGDMKDAGRRRPVRRH